MGAKPLFLCVCSYSQGFYFLQKVLDLKGDRENLDDKAPKPYSLNPIRPSTHSSKFVSLGKGQQAAKKIQKHISMLLGGMGGNLLLGTCSSFVLCAQPWPILTTETQPSVLYIPPKWCLVPDLACSWTFVEREWVNSGHEVTSSPCRPPSGRVEMAGKRLQVVIKEALVISVE